MCGIVGYVGKRNAQDVLLDGLEKLEYRGYDSAGVTLPNIRWALLYGVVLTNARAIGEFGAVSVVSGSIRGETLSLPLQIELLEQDYNTVGSFTAAALLTLMAILTLFLKSMLQWRLANQKERAQQEGNHEH